MAVIFIAAGGSGGHVIPAQVVADELLSRGHQVHFIVDVRGQKFLKPRPAMPVHLIKAGTIRSNFLHLVRDLIAMGWGLLQSFDLIRNHHPNIIVGFGGYPTVPPLIAAQLLGLPTLVHEGNQVIGAANKLLGLRAKNITLSFPSHNSCQSLPKYIVTGFPLRPEIDALATIPYDPPALGAPFHITIMGGSQGSTILGLPLAQIFCALPAHDRARLHLTHQVRENDLAAVKALYHNHQITATCQTFFTNIPEFLATTHLFIGRSGGSTVFEMATAGRPAIFIPLIAKSHKDAQQLDNANYLAQSGGASVILESDFTPENMIAKLTSLMHDPSILEKMSTQARMRSLPNATKQMAHIITNLIDKKSSI